MTVEEAIAIICQEYLCVDRDCDIERSCGKCDLAMPSKEPILEAYKMAIKVLQQEPCEDCISRQAVMVLAKEECETAIIPYKRFVKGINLLPPVTPKSKTGHWKLIQRGKFVDICCSECGHIRVKGFAYNFNVKDVYNSFQYEEFMKTSHLNFCENCGLKMLSTDAEKE